jgi:hypothetical protein
MWCQDYQVKKLNVEGACPNHKDRERKRSKEASASAGADKESGNDKKETEKDTQIGSGNTQLLSSSPLSRAE